jgi:septal ring factor EnvC (AmiA/AmiB activator)
MRFLSLVLLLLSLCSATAIRAQQSRTELERQRQETLRELEEINNTYNEVKKNKKESLGQLNLVQQKLRLRTREIENINSQIRAVDDSLFFINREIYRLKGDLDTLKANYAKSLIYAYKNRSSYDFLNFIFSATSFNDAVRRVEYLKSYRANREQQVADILKTQNLIASKAKDFANAKVAKGEVLVNDSKARAKLQEEKKEKDAVVADLRGKEKELSTNIRNKQRELSRLELGIKSAVRHEIEKETKAAAAAHPSPTVTAPTADVTRGEVPKTIHTSVLLDNAEAKTLANNFEKNKGRLPWPVSKGWIMAHYGKNYVEGMSLDYFNSGLTVGTDVGSSVKVIFDGTVTAVQDIGGKSNVIVRHGNYFTSYGNLASVSVNKGDKVQTGQAVGTVAEGDSGGGQLEFTMMREMDNINPESWLRPIGH